LDLNKSNALFSNSQHGTLTARLIRYGPAVLWIGVIFFFSSGSASAEQTSRFIRPLLLFFFPSSSEEMLLQYHFFIRKGAHFTEYAVLAFLTIRAFARSSFSILSKYPYLMGVLVVMVVSSLDEFNQSLEPSRTGAIWDVGLDIAGGAAMAAVLKLFSLRRRPIGKSAYDPVV
jgi:VanZ family protein